MRLACGFGLVVLGLCVTAARADDKAKLDPAKLVGSWTFASGVRDGKDVPAENLKKIKIEINKDAFVMTSDDGKFIMKYTLDSSKTPCQVSIEITEGPQGQGAKTEGIIQLKDDELKLCYPPMGGDVPKEFSAKEGSGLHLFVLKKKKSSVIGSRPLGSFLYQ